MKRSMPLGLQTTPLPQLYPCISNRNKMRIKIHEVKTIKSNEQKKVSTFTRSRDRFPLLYIREKDKYSFSGRKYRWKTGCEVNIMDIGDFKIQKTIFLKQSANSIIEQFEKTSHRDELTVLWPGIIFDTEANFRVFSPPLDNQTNNDSSCGAEIIHNE